MNQGGTVPWRRSATASYHSAGRCLARTRSRKLDYGLRTVRRRLANLLDDEIQTHREPSVQRVCARLNVLKQLQRRTRYESRLEARKKLMEDRK